MVDHTDLTSDSEGDEAGRAGGSSLGLGASSSSEQSQQRQQQLQQHPQDRQQQRPQQEGQQQQQDELPSQSQQRPHAQSAGFCQLRPLPPTRAQSTVLASTSPRRTSANRAADDEAAAVARAIAAVEQFEAREAAERARALDLVRDYQAEEARGAPLGPPPLPSTITPPAHETAPPPRKRQKVDLPDLDSPSAGPARRHVAKEQDTDASKRPKGKEKALEVDPVTGLTWFQANNLDSHDQPLAAPDDNHGHSTEDAIIQDLRALELSIAADEADEDGFEDYSAFEVPEDTDEPDDLPSESRADPSDTSLDHMKAALNMEPPAPFHSRPDADISRARCRQRMYDLWSVHQEEARHQTAAVRPHESWSFVPSFNSILARTSIDTGSNLLLNGYDTAIEEVLGREEITVEDLLSLPFRALTRQDLDESHIVYINMERMADGTIGGYLGSGTAMEGGTRRLQSYVDMVDQRRQPKTRYERLVARPDSQSNFRILWIGPRQQSPLVAALVEGMLATFFGTISFDIRSTTSTPARAMISARSIDFTRRNTSPAIATLTPLNVISPLKQSIHHRHFKATNICGGCDQEIKAGDRTRLVFSGIDNLLRRYHEICRLRERYVEQHNAHPEACSSCKYRGIASTCDGNNPCKNCTSLNTSKYGCFRFGELPFDPKSGPGRAHLSAERNLPGCFTCASRNVGCYGGSPPEPGEAVGTRCTRCKSQTTGCSIAGETSAAEAAHQRAQQSQQDQGPTENNQPCSACACARQSCYGGRPPGEDGAAGEKCLGCASSGKVCSIAGEESAKDTKARKSALPRCSTCARRKKFCQGGWTPNGDLPGKACYTCRHAGNR